MPRTHRIAALAMLLSVPAPAAEPEVFQEGDVVVGRILVDASADEVRSLLADPEACGALSSDAVVVQRQKKGRCEELTTETRGLFRKLRFRSLRCPTEDGGFHESLIESDDFNAYESTWSIREVDGRTEVTLRILTDLNLAVPDALVKKGTRRSVGELLDNLAQNVAR